MHKNYNFQTAVTNSPLSCIVTIRSPNNKNADSNIINYKFIFETVIF